jgi:hypothetical protein
VLALVIAQLVQGLLDLLELLPSFLSVSFPVEDFPQLCRFCLPELDLPAAFLLGFPLLLQSPLKVQALIPSGQFLAETAVFCLQEFDLPVGHRQLFADNKQLAGNFFLTLAVFFQHHIPQAQAEGTATEGASPVATALRSHKAGSLRLWCWRCGG